MGVFIIEVKDWSDYFILKISSDRVTCKGNEYKNPTKQVNRYRNVINHKITSVDEFTNIHDESIIPVYTFIFFPYLSRSFLNQNASAFANHYNDLEKILISFSNSFKSGNRYLNKKTLISILKTIIHLNILYSNSWKYDIDYALK